jgi:hypothetical protein
MSTEVDSAHCDFETFDFSDGTFSINAHPQDKDLKFGGRKICIALDLKAGISMQDAGRLATEPSKYVGRVRVVALK